MTGILGAWSEKLDLPESELASLLSLLLVIGDVDAGDVFRI